MDGPKNGPIWPRLKNQIYLSDGDFIDSVQEHLDKKNQDLQIPEAQKRPLAEILVEYERSAGSRDDAIVRPYASGAYSYQELDEYFGFRFTRVGKIVKAGEGNN